MRIKINGKEFKFFTNYNIDLKFNAIADTFSFSGIPTGKLMDMAYARCDLYDDNGRLLVAGIIMNISRKDRPKPEEPQISGYTISGQYEDTNMPINSFPLEFNSANLSEITRKLTGRVAYSNNDRERMHEPFNKVTIKPEQTIKDFLCDLAKQKGLFVSHLPHGTIVYLSEPTAGKKAVFNYSIDDGTATDIDIVFNGQGMHSSIVVFKDNGEFMQMTNKDTATPSAINLNSNPYIYDNGDGYSPYDAFEVNLKNIISKFKNTDVFDITEERDSVFRNENNSHGLDFSNPYCTINRTKIEVVNDTEGTDLQLVCRKMLTDNLMNITFTVESTILTTPGNIVNINGVECFVTEAKIKGTAKSETYTMTCYLADCFRQGPVKKYQL